MYVLAILTGLAIAMVSWYITSRWVASSILWIEHHYPQMIGTKAIKTSEVIICGLQVLACFALAIWVGRLMVV